MPKSATPSYSLEIRRDPIEYTTLDPYDSDPNWTFTDSHGHAHDASRQTLEWVVTSRYWCDDCRDWHEEGEYRCRTCGDVVDPGRRYVGNGPHYMPGLLNGTLIVSERFLDYTYVLRPDELASIPPEGATDQWVANIRRREPDDVAAMRER